MAAVAERAPQLTAARPGPAVDWTAVAGAATPLLPALAIAGAPVHARLAVVMAVALLGVVGAAAAGRAFPRDAIVVLAAFAAVAVEAWGLHVASSAGAGVAAAPIFGIAAGASIGRPRGVRALAGAFVVVGAVIVARFALGRDAALALGVALLVPGALAAALRYAALPSAATLAFAGAMALGGALAFAFIGATTPRANWFGAAVNHGPRDSDMVAITFDDGPDVEYTLKVADILDRHGVKGTFFLVGKALDARPDIAKALLARGEALGDHSYHHDSFSWLRPDYPEIADTQAAFRRNLGVCPALFRPPHGTRTPFMTRKAASAGMKTVTWDVSAADWATSDGELVARRVLEKVKPGSIILLHDGLDGNLTADRSVLLTALPIILDGLRERGLKPVTLPELLSTPAFVPC